MALSQDQIDALLGGGGGGGGGGLSPDDIDALASIGATAFAAGASAATQALGRKVTIAAPTVMPTSLDGLKKDHPQPMVVIQVPLTVGGSLEQALLLRERDGAIVFDLLMGRDGKNPD